MGESQVLLSLKVKSQIVPIKNVMLQLRRKAKIISELLKKWRIQM